MSLDPQKVVNRIGAGVILVLAILALRHFVSDWQQWRPLQDDRAAFAIGTVESREDKSYYAGKPRKTFRMAKIRYSFTVDNAAFHGAFECDEACLKFTPPQKGQEIRIRYAQDNPQLNRPNMLGVDYLIAIKVIMFACSAVILVALVVLWVG